MEIILPIFIFFFHLVPMKGFHLPSPLQELNIENDHSIRFFVKRDDLIHKDISGNKWRKLNYQIQDIIAQGQEGIITFGGAFSNHIVATAAASQLCGLKSVGIIRGESVALDNPTLQLAKSYGMNFHFVNRSAYRLKQGSDDIATIISKYPNFELIPEGGSHPRALIGVGEIIDELKKQVTIDFDYALCSVGTGTTFAGLAKSFEGELIGINALKNESIVTEICAQLDQSSLQLNQTILHDFHFGGYAKHTTELIDFMHQLYEHHKVKTDVIYTSKLFFAAIDLLKQDYFKAGSHVLIYHSGGLQGNTGMNYRFPDLITFV